MPTFERVLLVATLILVTGCAEPMEVSTDSAPRSLDEISIPDGFDFATSRDISVTVRTDPPSSESPSRVHVGVRDDSGRFDLMFEGFLGADGTFQALLPLATWRDEITVRIDAGSGLVSADLRVEGGAAAYPEGTIRESVSPGSLSPSFSTLETGSTASSGPQRVPEDLSGFPIAYTSYYPSQSTYGTIAFEDNWPWKGDYDFNDLVLSYHIVMYRSPSFDVVAMEFFFKVEAVGADFRNGFGLSLPVSTQRITTAYGNLTDRADDNGFEPGQDQAVFILFDTPSAAANGDATMMNTLPGESLVDTPEIRFVVQFRTPLKDTDLGTPPFDPFLFVNGDRGREIHLIGKSSTGLADPSYLGSADDSGNYSTLTGLPWAILVPDAWPWPSERTQVSEAHLEFIPWAESGGTLYTDWFLSKGNNRDPNKLISR